MFYFYNFIGWEVRGLNRFVGVLDFMDFLEGLPGGLPRCSFGVIIPDRGRCLADFCVVSLIWLRLKEG